jgi:hypothetical protein
MRPIAESWSILASLVMTAKLNGIDAQTYLTDCWSASSPGELKAISCTNFSPGIGRPHASERNELPHEFASPHAVGGHGEGGHAAR